jgi:hypothetical protein
METTIIMFNNKINNLGKKKHQFKEIIKIMWRRTVI